MGCALPRKLVRGRMLDAQGALVRGGFVIKDEAVAHGHAHEATLELGDLVILPGAIDPHVHFRDPGHPEKEDFGSGTRAAALGGVTTVLDMPNTVPPVTTRTALVDKKARAQAKAVVDFGLFAGLDEKGDALSILPDAVALKIYLGSTTGDLLVRDDAVIRRALEAAANARRTVVLHAESQACLDRHADLVGKDYASHSASRPGECEVEAIARVAKLSEGIGHSRVHVAHLSSAEGLAALAKTAFSAEVTPHHLLFDAARLTTGAFKMNPPLRAHQDTQALWAALTDGRIPCLASDHAPHTPAEKSASDQRRCPSGVPGVQTMVPLMLAAGLPLARVAQASTAAARIFGLARKGTISPGNDADFAAYDLADVRPVRARDMASKAGWTPFEGLPAVFPKHVFVRGRAVVRDGVLVDALPAGRLVATQSNL